MKKILLSFLFFTSSLAIFGQGKRIALRATGGYVLDTTSFPTGVTSLYQNSLKYDASNPLGFIDISALSGYLLSTTASSTYQPLDADLTAIASLSTDAFGRDLLIKTSADDIRSYIGLGTLATQSGTFSGTSSGTNTGDQDLSSYATTTAVAAAYQPLDADLTTISGLTATTDNFLVSVSSAWASRTPSQVRTTLGLVIGTDVQAYDADLITWSGITPGSGVGTFISTPSSANLASAVTDETGTGVSVFSASPALTGVPTAPTAAPGTNSTQIATTAFVIDAATIYVDGTSISGAGTLASPFVARTPDYKSVTTDFVTTSTTVVPVTNLTSNTLAVGEYEFDAWLSTGETNASGLQFQLTTTGTITSQYVSFGRTTSSSAFAGGNGTALNSTLTAHNTVNAATGFSWYRGKLFVTAAGTITISVKAVAGTATVFTGSFMKITKMN